MMHVQKSVMRKFLDGVNPLFTRAFLPWLVRHPRYLRAGIRLARSFKKAERIRDKQGRMGVRIPPVLILSVTSTCNLFCLGCYASASLTNNQNASSDQRQLDNGLKFEEWKSIIESARDLGVFGFIIAGGEPFLYPKILDLCMQFKDLFFLFVTNGTALTKSDFEKLRNASNIGVIVSLEGPPETHDARRGAEVYAKAYKTIQRLGSLGVITGVSATITRENYKYWMNARNIESLIKEGVRIGIFIEYIPSTKALESARTSLSPCADQGLMLEREENQAFRSFVIDYRENNPFIIIHSPNDEDYFGGCVSAGRGFAHVTPSGDLTPCPVSNLATHNLQESPLRDGFASPLFTEIRKNGHLLKDHDLPCALLSHQEEIAVLARKVGAYWTDTGEPV
ncbi:MAG: radical SAM/SPASM domain-containing protein [Candidatus Thorarchaeota archaeon]